VGSYSIALNVDPINGSSPLEVCVEMVRLSTQLGILINTNMNGIALVAAPNEDPEALHREWEQRMKRAQPWKT
jgi:hypothetical protein